MTSKITISLLANLILLQHLTKCEKNLLIRKCERCHDGKKYASDIYAKVVVRNGIQYMSANVTLNEDFGDNLMTDLKVLLAIPGTNRFAKIFETKEKFCKMAKTYIGPFLYDLEKAAQILPGACPIPKGKYHLSDFPLNINKILVKDVVPAGSVKFTCEFIDIKSKQKILCLDVEVEVSQ